MPRSGREAEGAEERATAQLVRVLLEAPPQALRDPFAHGYAASLRAWRAPPKGPPWHFSERLADELAEPDAERLAREVLAEAVAILRRASEELARPSHDVAGEDLASLLRPGEAECLARELGRRVAETCAASAVLAEGVRAALAAAPRPPLLQPGVAAALQAESRRRCEEGVAALARSALREHRDDVRGCVELARLAALAECRKELAAARSTDTAAHVAASSAALAGSARAALAPLQRRVPVPPGGLARRLADRLRPAAAALLADAEILDRELRRGVRRGASAEAAAAAPSEVSARSSASSAPFRSPVSAPGAPATAPARSAEVAGAAEPRQRVILNCSNIGFSYGGWLTARGIPGASNFDWAGVRRAVEYYVARGVQPQGICQNATARISPVPPDLEQYVTVCPVVDNEPDVDDLFTIRSAMNHGCQLVDNDNYRDWRSEDKPGARADVRQWLLRGEGVSLKVNYLFDLSGKFIPSVPPPAGAGSRC